MLHHSRPNTPKSFSHRSNFTQKIPGTDYVPIGPAVSIKNQIGWTTYQSLLILGPLMSPGIVPNNIYAVAIFDGAFASDQGMLNTPAIIEFPVF